MNVSLAELDNLSRAVKTPRPSEWILSPFSGQWRAASKLSLVLPPAPRWSSDNPVKMLKGEMMMFLLGSSRVWTRSMRNVLLALRGGDERQEVQQIQKLILLTYYYALRAFVCVIMRRRKHSPLGAKCNKFSSVLLVISSFLASSPYPDTGEDFSHTNGGGLLEVQAEVRTSWVETSKTSGLIFCSVTARQRH